jgi:hypothetical protein
MSDIVFIRSGHGYESGSYGRCTAFDDYTVIANPLGGNDNAAQDSRVFGRDERGYGGVTYGAYDLKLARDDYSRDLYLLVSHGAGREVWRLPSFSDKGALNTHILAMPERLQYALLMTLYRTASYARRQAQGETRREWAQAYIDGRIRKARATKDRNARVEIIEKTVVDA